MCMCILCKGLDGVPELYFPGSCFLTPGTMFKRSEEPRSPDQNMARRVLEDSLALGTVQVMSVVFG